MTKGIVPSSESFEGHQLSTSGSDDSQNRRPSFFSSAKSTVSSYASSFFSRLRKDTPAVINKEEATIDEQALKDAMRVSQEIEDLQEKIKLLDAFVLSNQELKTLCEASVKTYLKRIALVITPDTSHLNNDDPVDNLTLLSVRKNHLSHALQERMIIIMEDPEFYETFKRSMNSEKEEEPGLLSIGWK